MNGENKNYICTRTDCIYYDNCKNTQISGISQQQLCLYENYSMYEEDA